MQFRASFGFTECVEECQDWLRRNRIIFRNREKGGRSVSGDLRKGAKRCTVDGCHVVRSVRGILREHGSGGYNRTGGEPYNQNAIRGDPPLRRICAHYLNRLYAV